MADKVGVFNRLLYAGSGVTTATHEFEFLEGSTLGLSENFIDTNGIRGTRSHSSERVRRGTRRVDGQIILAPTPVELAVWLPLILGGTPSGTSYPLGENLPLFNLFGVRDGTVYTYSDCVVTNATFSASEGGPMQLSLTIIGKDETQSGSAGAATIDLTTQPFVLHDAVVSVGGSNREVASFSLAIDNVVEAKFRNSATITQLKATDRNVTVDLPVSLGTDAALYGSAVGGVATTLTLTNGGCSLTFSMTKVQAPKQPLPFGQRGILDLPWRGVARKDGATPELTTTLDSTP
ncbi:hypothetical protein GobsT_37730 [Gemmata obscuriglobus]|uniref:Uncharacterized protein n=1 Tax=Gemmata obscuriglobus TaxID=114 RepID=A0A2Z3H8U0_9BACT|nr:phage tail tube protein [Gemmata obscuriglobus]AWM38134.1 hypothetical protein C1280_14780 [Gemmata obscuriglobus]QEG28984.1 hypothetical protein GobsT_37730 [Gemmata obscuriglobus]VTS07543.1 Uncharacterized protein OS=Planctomyces brasiliensis (strain ATCC 49424 / DSM 5305 / JCM 21570 / NBRC 103401 / IFAM 1448) GN=Plabr_0230 PE=4 SV=1 [Gemmata obscuriglobus UQM 2246]